MHAHRCGTAIIVDIQAQSSSSNSKRYSMEDWKRKMDQEIGALRNEVDRSLRAKQDPHIIPLSFPSTSNNSSSLFSSKIGGYRPPTLNASLSPEDYEYGGSNIHQLETERLIQSSEAMLLESKALCVQSEEIGNESIQALMRQREQLQSTSDYVNITRVHLMQARILLKHL